MGSEKKLKKYKKIMTMRVTSASVRQSSPLILNAFLFRGKLKNACTASPQIAIEIYIYPCGVSPISMPMELHHHDSEHDGVGEKIKRNKKEAPISMEIHIISICFNCCQSLNGEINSTINSKSPPVAFKLPQSSSQLISKQSIKAAIKQAKK